MRNSKMKKNVVYWTGIKNPDLAEKYGNFDYFEYSKATWKYWCDKNDCIFVEFDEPVEPDMFQFRVNWQKAIFVFDELERKGIDYDQIFLVDSSCMIKWDAPNVFELTDHKFCGWPDIDNMKWIYDSIQGYKSFFDNFKLDQQKYVSSGVIIFNELHKEFFNSFKQLYYNNVATFCDLQDNIVKKGTEQTPMNYWLQINDIDVKTDLPIAFKLTHMHRKDMFSYNWQDGTDKTPFFIKYGYNWVFNGIPKDQRSQIMRQTWDMVKHHYSNDAHENILHSVRHKDVFKNATTRQFKRDLLKIFDNEKYRHMTAVEFGSAEGDTSKVLSTMFNHVYCYDWAATNINVAKDKCKHINNISFLQFDITNPEWDIPKADIVFIDARHATEDVNIDIERVLQYFDDPIIIMDDYGNPRTGVRSAIDKNILNGNLTISHTIGEVSGYTTCNNVVFNDKEGIICNLNES